MECEVKIIRVYAQGELSTCARAYRIARDKITANYHSKNYVISFEERNLTEIVNLGLTEDEHIDWLTGKDDCMILCHPFQGDYPPDWNYKYFLSKLKEVATTKNVRMFPNPDLLDDPTFSQVCVLKRLLI